MCCSAADTHNNLLNLVVNGASFITGGVLECNIANRQAVAVLFIRSGVTNCTSYGSLSARVNCGALVALGILIQFVAAGPRSTERLLFPSQYLCGTIFVKLNSMV